MLSNDTKNVSGCPQEEVLLKFQRGGLGKEDKETVIHIDKCERCQRALLDIERFDALFVDALKKNEGEDENHLTDEELSAYIEDDKSMDKHAVSRIQTHLLACKNCREELATISCALGGEETQEPSLFKKILKYLKPGD